MQKKRSRTEEKVTKSAETLKKGKIGHAHREPVVRYGPPAGQASYQQALKFLLGKGVPRDVALGLELLEMRAYLRHRYRPAARLLGQIYVRGLFKVGVDLKKAAYWLALAPESGRARDLYDLGTAHLRCGNRKGWDFIEQAARTGYGKAQYKYGRHGLRLAKHSDQKEAFRENARQWFVEAQDNGIPEARAQLEKMRVEDLNESADVLFGLTFPKTKV